MNQARLFGDCLRCREGAPVKFWLCTACRAEVNPEVLRRWDIASELLARFCARSAWVEE